MLRIEYTEKGKAYSDFEVDAKAKEIIDLHLEYSDPDLYMVYRTSSASLIDAIRLEIIDRKIGSGFLEFVCNGEVMSVNEFGNPDRWVDGFCDLGHKRLFKILKAQRKMMMRGLNK